VLGVGRNRTPRARLKARLLGEIAIEVVLDGKEKKRMKERGGAPFFRSTKSSCYIDVCAFNFFFRR
jgi:hypothetical protein